MEEPHLFAAAAAALLGAPGPTNALLTAAGASAGVVRSLHVLIAVLAAYLITVVTFGALLGSLLPDGSRTWLSLFAAVYLAILAARLWRAAAGTEAADVRWQHAFTATLLNPKGLVLAFVVVPFATGPGWLHLAAFSLLVIVTGGAWLGFGALLGSVGGRSMRAIVPKATSGVLAASAIALVMFALRS